MPKLLKSAYLHRLFRMGESDYLLYFHIYLCYLERLFDLFPYLSVLSERLSVLFHNFLVIICFISIFICAIQSDYPIYFHIYLCYLSDYLFHFIFFCAICPILPGSFCLFIFMIFDIPLHILYCSTMLLP